MTIPDGHREERSDEAISIWFSIAAEDRLGQ
jgi:hypothetical protein